MLLLSILILLLQGPSLNATHPGDQSQVDALLEQGLRAEAEGRYMDALESWVDAREAAIAPDLRIGREYIRLAAEQQMDSLYTQASDMYFWGLSAERVAPNREALQQEIDFLEPLASDDELRAWRTGLENNDPAIYHQLAGFWRSLDPTVTTDYNERLIEHWRRIAYARANFDRGQSTAYGTDERGDIYLRYGEPDLIRNGNLLFNSSTARAIISDVFQAAGVNPTSWAWRNTNIGNFPNAFTRATQNFHSNPEYEIWIYRDLNPSSNEPVIYTFGSNGNTGIFEEVASIDEFIPDEALSMGSSQILTITGIQNHVSLDDFPSLKNLRVGVVLQMMYYDQLSTVDSHFGDMYQEISSRLNDAASLSPSLGQEMLTRAQMELQENRLRAPREVSEEREAIREIPLSIHQYRVLDRNGNPALATFFQSEPQEAFLIDYLYNYDDAGVTAVNQLSRSGREQARNRLNNYRLVHQVRLFDASWQPVEQYSETPGVAIQSGDRSRTFHLIPNLGADARQVFGAELHNDDNTSAGRTGSTSFPERLRGAGSLEISQPEALNSDPSQLQMSDLILGHDLDSAAPEDAAFPFTISHSRQLPDDKELVLHVETYNLQQNEEGITDFELTYRILKPNTFMTWLRGDYNTSLELTLNLQTDTPVYKENLEVKTRELDPGEYLLRLQATDNLSGQSVTREVEITIEG